MDSGRYTKSRVVSVQMFGQAVVRKQVHFCHRPAARPLYKSFLKMAYQSRSFSIMLPNTFTQTSFQP